MSMPVFSRGVRFSLCALCASSVLASCGGEGGGGDQADGDDAKSGASANNQRVVPTVTRGSDGIELLTFSPTAFEHAPKLSLDSVPLAETAGSAGSRDFDLTYVSQVRLLSDNRMVTFANIGASLLLFGADGKEERRIGRLGKGPGEFMRPGGVVALPGDTLFVSDVANNRLNWVMPDGRFVRTPAMAWEKLTLRPERLIGVLPDGQLVLSSAGRVSWSESDTVYRSMASVVVQPAVGASREIVKVPDLAIVTIPRRLRGRIQRENEVLRFTPTAHVALWDSLITSNDGSSYRITMRTATGTAIREISIPLTKRPVTADMKEKAFKAALAQIEGFVGEGSGGDLPTKDELRESVRLTPSMDSMPLVHGLYVAPNGTLWVLDMSAASGTTGIFATAFDKDGAIIGRLPLPEGASPVAFGADRVVLRVRDADDVVALRVHRIVPTQRAALP